jgi:hypothetical protein
LKTLVLFITFSCLAFSVVAQAPSDTTKLPFAIADEKKIDPEDLNNKKEGAYVTGVPNFSSDPLNGFGYGIEGSLYFNGQRSDPFFEYTPYRSKFDIALFNTTNQAKEFRVSMDIPYVFDSKWRLRAEAAYENNPNLLYFGHTETSLNKLTNPASEQQYETYSTYDESLTDPYLLYNNYIKDEYILNLSAERSFLQSKMRALVGAEVAIINISTFNNNALISTESQKRCYYRVWPKFCFYLSNGFGV